MEDTIAAISTVIGESGIGIVRISGSNAKNILDQIFKSKYNSDSSSMANRQLVYGHIYNPASGAIVDEVMCVYMKAPNTYTREDIVEIQCHGSVVSVRKILSLVISLGARPADPGEFTKRAFLNGRIDLSQAEAVIDVIKAKSDISFRTAVKHLDGSISKKIKFLRTRLMDILIQLAVNIDYPDEDIEELTYNELIDSLKSIGDEIDKLIDSSQIGRIISEGLRVAIVGRPNVGKSSLLNALLGEERAIVTEIPGTTRDTIEEGLDLKGIPLYIADTAGIRNTNDPIELLGIERSKLALEKADLIIFMIDASSPLGHEDFEIADNIADRKSIVILNKMDLGKVITMEDLIDIIPSAKFIDTSILLEKGIDELKNTIESLVYEGLVIQNDDDIITNIRHKNLLEEARKDINDGMIMACQLEALDFIEVDIRHAWELLGDILGETVSEDIIDAVFERFCLGK